MRLTRSKLAGAGVAALALVAVTAAQAQTPPGDLAPSVPHPNASSNTPSASTTPPAITTGSGESHTNAAPVAGQNSFTESQARERLEKYGYTNVSKLAKDDQSVWRGDATKDGKSVHVALDYQGNIVAH